MQLLDFIALILAADAVVTLWFYSSIFEKLRESIEKRGGLIGELAGCPLCFSFHSAFWLFLFFVLPTLLIPNIEFVKLPLYVLSAATVVQFLQGIHPGPGDLEEKEEDDEYDEADGEDAA